MCAGLYAQNVIQEGVPPQEKISLETYLAQVDMVVEEILRKYPNLTYERSIDVREGELSDPEDPKADLNPYSLIAHTFSLKSGERNSSEGYSNQEEILPPPDTGTAVFFIRGGGYLYLDPQGAAGGTGLNSENMDIVAYLNANGYKAFLVDYFVATDQPATNKWRIALTKLIDQPCDDVDAEANCVFQKFSIRAFWDLRQNTFPIPCHNGDALFPVNNLAGMDPDLINTQDTLEDAGSVIDSTGISNVVSVQISFAQNCTQRVAKIISGGYDPVFYYWKYKGYNWDRTFDNYYVLPEPNNGFSGNATFRTQLLNACDTTPQQTFTIFVPHFSTCTQRTIQPLPIITVTQESQQQYVWKIENTGEPFNGKIQVLNTLGQIITHFEVQVPEGVSYNQVFMPPQLPIGTYIFHIQGDNQIQSLPFIVNH